VGLPLLSSFSFLVREGYGQPAGLFRGEPGRSIADFFGGEELTYDIGFWIFKQAAYGKLSFKEAEKKGRYVATLQAETLGVLGWVARYRVDTYRSTMEEIDDGNRLRSLSFEEEVKVGSKRRRRTYLFDYLNRKWTKVRLRRDGTTEKDEEGIPPGKIYDDFLTASYNFRYGVYGAIERGRKYTVSTFPRKGTTSYEVRIAEKQEEDKRKKSEKVKEGKDFLVKLFLDPEVTHSKEGKIEGWLSKDGLPVEGTIKDVVLFGDVKGTLIKKN
jgi:hypothetical protein